MCNPIFDYDDGDFIYQTSGNMGIDSDDDLHMRIGDNMSMDMVTDELHFNSGWKMMMTMIISSTEIKPGLFVLAQFTCIHPW